MIHPTYHTNDFGQEMWNFCMKGIKKDQRTKMNIVWNLWQSGIMDNVVDDLKKTVIK